MKVRNKKAFVIPLVVFAIGLAGVFVMIYNTTIQSQRRLDLLTEQDMRSYYIAQAGFQYYLGRYKNTSRYEERWYSPQSSYSERKGYGYDEEGGQGFFEFFVEEITNGAEFSHLFIIVRGVYKPQAMKSEQNITMLRGNLRFSPRPPSEEPQTTVLEAVHPISKAQLLQYVTDARYADFFKGQDRQFSLEIKKLLEFLDKKDILDIDFTNQQDLLKAMAQLEVLNEKLRQRLRTVSELQKIELAQELKSFQLEILDGRHPHLSPLDVEKRLSFDLIDDSFFHQIAAGSGNLAEKLDEVIQRIPRDQKQQLAINNSIYQLDKLNSRFTVTIAAPIDPDIPPIIKTDDAQTISIKDLVHTLQNMLQQGDVKEYDDFLQRIENQNIQINGANSKLSIISLLDATKNDLNRLLEKDSGTNEDSLEDYSSERQRDKEELDAEEDLLADNTNDPERKKRDRKGRKGKRPWRKKPHETENPAENSDDEKEFIDDQGLRPDIIFPELYGKEFANISIVDELNNNTPGGQGLKQEYLDYLNHNMKAWYFNNFVLNQKEPTKDDFDKFKQEHPIPDFQMIDQVGNILDKLVESNTFDFKHVMPTRNVVARNTQAKKTIMDIPRDVFKVEIFKKLRYHTPPPRNNQELIELFKTSVLADTKTGGLFGTAYDEDGNAVEPRMFLVDKKTGQQIFMDDYIRSQLGKS